jgi:2-polyprenyl-6-methoxyphenol hydroxylase-like FAD-dependent oxidoreductase
VSDDRVIIAGGGIAGLVLALELDARSIPCVVYEAAPELRPLGVGINLLPHAVRVLAGLGLGERLERIAVATRELAYYNRHGQRIWAEARGRAAGYAFPQLSIHRGALQMELLGAVRERLGPEAVHLGRAVGVFVASGDGVRVNLNAGRSGPTIDVVEGSILVGAEGVNAAVRAQLHPHDGPPRFAGRILWRGITQGRPFLDGRTMIMAGHPRQKFVAYPITPVGADGLQSINWIAELPVAGEAPPAQDWSRRVDVAVFRGPFAGWRFDWLDVPALIDGAEAVFEYPLVDRDPLDHWGNERVTLIGDAAHPMYPIGSNGASQAILDAEALANALARRADRAVALAEYEEARLGPTAAIVLANREHGPEQVMQLAEERAPSGFSAIEDVIPRAELQAIADRYKQVAGFTAEQVNVHAARESPAPPVLRFSFEIRATTGEPIDVPGGGDGDLEVYPITGGTVTGPGLSGVVRAGGADWSRARADGILRVDARFLIKALDGGMIEVVNTGVWAERGYFRTAPVFRTGAPAHGHLTDRLYIADVVEEIGGVVLRVFEVL